MILAATPSQRVLDPCGAQARKTGRPRSSTKERAMRRPAVLILALAAAIATGLLATMGAFGSSHREAPRIMLDPAADNTDVYAFTAPDAQDNLTVVSNWVPLEEPAGGPYFGKLDPKARYYVKIDNTGDGYEDVAYRWQFKNRFRNPNSFLYAAPTVDSVNDPDLNFVQTYDLFKETYKNRHLVRSRKITSPAVPPPRDSGAPTTTPNSERVAAGAFASLGGGGKTFVGPREDPF